jgi:hypothetical protein
MKIGYSQRYRCIEAAGGKDELETTTKGVKPIRYFCSNVSDRRMLV